MLIALALALAVQQEPAVLDAPAWQDSTWRVALPRPFDDWVFAPASSRRTTTVIFQPRAGRVSDQLWGALVLTHWGGPVALDSVAERRLQSQWRPTLGPGFAVLARDSIVVAGWPCIHFVVTGSIHLAVLDVEEFIIARDHDLVVLQLRYPRGVERDSVAAGYRRTVEGLRLGGAAGLAPTSAAWQESLESGQQVFDLPEDMRAIAPGTLTADASSRGRRIMRWRPLLGEADTTLFAVGRYHMDERRVGRLTLRIWRADTEDTLVVRATDTVVAELARDFGMFWRDFGPVPLAELTVVETPAPQTRGGGGAVFLGADASAFTLAREISRTWWGGLVRADATNAVLVTGALPLLAARLATNDSSIANDSRLRALDEARGIAGAPRFREALRTFVFESRGDSAATARLLDALGPEAAAAMTQLIHSQ
ncbi:MAG: hypothetical protein ACHQU1_10715 [Gemmatimonadales bacterium]